MNQRPQAPKHAEDQDPVWNLLAKSPTTQAGPNFASDTVRLARLMGQVQPWWKRWLQPLPLSGLAVATAALALTVTGVLRQTPDSQSAPSAHFNSPQAKSIQDIAETEILIAAADTPGNFSDQELVCLLGF